MTLLKQFHKQTNRWKKQEKNKGIDEKEDKEKNNLDNKFLSCWKRINLLSEEEKVPVSYKGEILIFLLL